MNAGTHCGGGASSLPAMAQTAGTRAQTPVSDSRPDGKLRTGSGAPVALANQPDLVTGDEARSGTPALVTGIRHWSTATYTRVAIDLGDNVTYEAARVPNPDRIYFDLHGTRLAPELVGKSFAVTDDGFLKKVRAAQYSDDVTRVVLDVNDVTEYSAFLLPNPYRLIIDIHGGKEQGSGNDETPVATESPAPRAAVPVKPTAARPVPNSVATKSATSEVADLSEFAGKSGGDEQAYLEADLGGGGDRDRFEVRGSRFEGRYGGHECCCCDTDGCGCGHFGEFRQEDAQEQGEGGGQFDRDCGGCDAGAGSGADGRWRDLAGARAGVEDRAHRDRPGPRRARLGNDRRGRDRGEGRGAGRGAAPGQAAARPAGRGDHLHALRRYVCPAGDADGDRQQGAGGPVPVDPRQLVAG